MTLSGGSHGNPHPTVRIHILGLAARGTHATDHWAIETLRKLGWGKPTWAGTRIITREDSHEGIAGLDDKAKAIGIDRCGVARHRVILCSRPAYRTASRACWRQAPYRNSCRKASCLRKDRSALPTAACISPTSGRAEPSISMLAAGFRWCARTPTGRT